MVISLAWCSCRRLPGYSNVSAASRAGWLWKGRRCDEAAASVTCLVEGRRLNILPALTHSGKDTSRCRACNLGLLVTLQHLPCYARRF